MILRIFLPITFIVVPVLAPVNRLSGNDVRTASLDVFSISNVAPRHAASRLWIHWALGALVVAWVCYVVHHETLAYIEAKQRYTSNRDYQGQLSANTILVANIPNVLLTEEKLKKVFGVFPGGVRDVHISRDTGNLSSMLATRDQIVEAIEVAETKLIAMCVSEHFGVHRILARSICTPRTCLDILRRKGFGKARPDGVTACGEVSEDRTSKIHRLRQRPRPGTGKQGNLGPTRQEASLKPGLCVVGNDEDMEAAWRRYVRPQDRETTRLPLFAKSWFPSLPLVGRKVDRILHLQYRLQELNQEIDLSVCDRADERPLLNNAFVRFNDQIAAHLACQSVIHGEPYCMGPRILDVNPNDVLWDNLALGWRQRWIRVCISLSASTGLIVLYAVPVAFTSFLANLDVLASNVSWLSWLQDWPESIKSILQGVLPPALLQVILLLVPVVYRWLMHFQGAATGNVRELGVQTWFFLFLFVQVSTHPSTLCAEWIVRS